MNLYKNHTDRELITVLDNVNKLTYEAQLNLLREFNKRKITQDTSTLQLLISETETAIRNLDVLKDLGFKAQFDDDSLIVKRDSSAQLMDIVAIVIGFMLALIGLIHFWLLIAMFFGDNEFTLTKLITYALMILAGGVGFKMLKGVHRFLDYRSFSLEQKRDSLEVHKGGDDLKYVPQDASLETQDEELIFKLGDNEIIYASAYNLKQKMTLEELVRKIKNIG
ncbi:hypothetical protein [Dokdonia sp. Hel_I_53]|uniref:hypothetical protein n=1 Tax=Dokdonia sp. Hel_I_53 TaxID=1566287 RepID=UPI00119AF1EB|nr:hypothetical protein [Dokdonia sp. Hel_I_53]TVZ52137.1 hypothetical protein OD90_1302 [Dokdonia sp. Hel_I_53]